jgi:hypothetical protein
LSAFAAVDHQPQVFYAEPFLDQTILRIDHVLVIVFRKRRIHSVGRFRGFAVAENMRLA